MDKNRKIARFLPFILMTIGLALLLLSFFGCSATVESAEEPRGNHEKTVRLYIDDSKSLYRFIEGKVTVEFSTGEVFSAVVAANRVNQKYVNYDATVVAAKIEDAKYANGTPRAFGIGCICFGVFWLINNKLLQKSK